MCYRKHPTRQFYKISVLRGKSYVVFSRKLSWKIYLFLWYFFLLENLMCSNDISDKISWKYWSFLWYFFLLENRMCSCRILRKLSWKFWCVLVHFASPGKFTCVLVPFLVLLESLMCSYKRIMSSPGKLEVFLLHPSLLENLMCSRNLFKKILEKRTDILTKKLVGCFWR